MKKSVAPTTESLGCDPTDLAVRLHGSWSPSSSLRRGCVGSATIRQRLRNRPARGPHIRVVTTPEYVKSVWSTDGSRNKLHQSDGANERGGKRGIDHKSVLHGAGIGGGGYRESLDRVQADRGTVTS